MQYTAALTLVFTHAQVPLYRATGRLRLSQESQCSIPDALPTSIPYSGLFLNGFYFGYFEEAFFCENKFPGLTVIRKYIRTIKQNACLHSHDYIIFATLMRFAALLIFHCPQLLIRSLLKLCTLAAHRFETAEKAITILANICSGE